MAADGLPERVPAPLREALLRLDASADRQLAIDFFTLADGRSGVHELVLERERKADEALTGDVESAIVLKLDFDAKSWKRVRKKVKAI